MVSERHQQKEVHPQRYHMHLPVSPNTSSTALTETHGTGLAASNWNSSSFQTPVFAAQALAPGPLTSPVRYQSSSQSTSVAACPSPPQIWPMGHGPSKATPPHFHTSLPSQSTTPGFNPVFDAGSTNKKVLNLAGKKLKRVLGSKNGSNDSKLEMITDTVASKFSSPIESTPESTPPKKFAQSAQSFYTADRSPLSQVPVQGVASSSSNLQPLVPSHRRSSKGSSSLGNFSGKSSLDVPAVGGNRSSVIAVSPGISSAINYMMMEWPEVSPPKLVVDTSVSIASVSQGTSEYSKPNREDITKDKETGRRRSDGSAPTSPDKREMKESWRKSDSTNSHHTVRANSFKASRPVSWAESFHSAYTIVPANGGMTAPQGLPSRRLSGLIADVDFGVQEEELEDDIDANAGGITPLGSYHFATPNSIQLLNKGVELDPLTSNDSVLESRDLIRKAKRRSISLSSALPGPVASLLTNTKSMRTEPSITTPEAPAMEVRKVSHSISGVDSFKNVNHHIRQHSENLLRQRPQVSIYSVDTTYHAPSMEVSSASGSRRVQHDSRPSAIPNVPGWHETRIPPSRNSQLGFPTETLNTPTEPFVRIPNQFDTPSSNYSHLRRPAVSGLGPSAAGIAKRAVERMSRRLGDIMNGFNSSSNSSVSGHSSSASISSSASTSMTSGQSLIPSPLMMDGGTQQTPLQAVLGFVPGRTPSRGSNHGTPVSHHHGMLHAFLPGPSKSGGHKRLHKSFGSSAVINDIVTGGASSSTLSSSSPSTSTSDTDPTKLVFGRCLREPFKKGVLFGVELKAAVKKTRVAQADDGHTDDEGSHAMKVDLIKELEARVLPAVVVRCAQHLLIWGVLEEGLFRINGRLGHVNLLRAEFDSGADYDMTECSPDQLDPHAVASVFKGYVRELPDSILTQKLQPYFDAAINQENTYGQQHPFNQSATWGVSSTPVTPISLRKPPSLSTLAMPAFTRAQPPSKSLINALRSLIAQLPSENRDLLRTIVDVINATAKGSNATKMPLSNLLLLFCPSLNMSPPLLRVLCETEDLWDEERGTEDIAVDSDSELRAPVPPGTSMRRDEDETDARFDEGSSLWSGRASSDNTSSLDYHASAEEDSLFSEERVVLRRDLRVRPEIPTVYLDTLSHLSSSSASSLRDDQETCQHTGPDALRQDLRDDGSISSGPSDSVSTPISSANPSVSNLPLDANQVLGQKSIGADLHYYPRTSPLIVGSDDTEIRKRPFISNPIPISGPLPPQYPFPTSRSREHILNTPSRRRSIPILSLSSLSSRSSGSASPLGRNSPVHAEHRSKRPSLKLLFSKKSTSSLFEEKERPVISLPLPLLRPPEPFFQQERVSSGSGSDSSVSTPLSAVTAPQGSLLCLSDSLKEGPPVLNTRIEDSSLKLEELMTAENKICS